MFAYAILLAGKHDLNIGEIVREKLIESGKYPADKAKGKALNTTSCDCL